MSFVSRIPIRFSDEDHARIVYYPRYFHFFHVAFEEFFNANGFTYRDVLDVQKLGWPAVHSEADFKSPLRMGDVLLVTVTIERVGEKSVTFVYTGRREDNGALVVRGKTTVVCTHLDTMASLAIPAQFRAFFESHIETTS